MQADSTIPLGFCQCGCGQRTTIPAKSSTRFNRVKGIPMRYVLGHQVRVRKYPSPVERFWANVAKAEDPNGCWLWTAATRNGYGRLRVRPSGPGKSATAHRFSWELHNGPIPPGMLVCHKCDNPACCNPAHLFLGTGLDNMHDCIAKGRAMKSRGDSHYYHTHPELRRTGAQHPQAKLTWEIVREMRQRYAAGGISEVALAKEYGVSHGNIHFILSCKTWRE